jgi:hypothetical protein
MILFLLVCDMYRLTFSMPDIWLIKEGLPSDVSTGDQALFYITRESLVSYSSISGNLVVFVEEIRPLNEREKIHLFLRDVETINPLDFPYI